MSHKEIISSRLAISSVPAHLTAAGCRLFSCSLSRTPRDGHSKCWKKKKERKHKQTKRNIRRRTPWLSKSWVSIYTCRDICASTTSSSSLSLFYSLTKSGAGNCSISLLLPTVYIHTHTHLLILSSLACDFYFVSSPKAADEGRPLASIAICSSMFVGGEQILEIGIAPYYISTHTLEPSLDGLFDRRR